MLRYWQVLVNKWRPALVINSPYKTWNDSYLMYCVRGLLIEHWLIDWRPYICCFVLFFFYSRENLYSPKVRQPHNLWQWSVHVSPSLLKLASISSRLVSYSFSSVIRKMWALILDATCPYKHAKPLVQSFKIKQTNKQPKPHWSFVTTVSN